MKVTTRVHSICLGPNKYWFDEFNIKSDRCNRVSAHFFGGQTLGACTY